MIGALRREAALLVKEARGELDPHVGRTHLKEADEGDLGGRRFTRRMEQYLDHPPAWLVAYRRREYPLIHYKARHPVTEVGGGCTVGCTERLGWRIVTLVVIERQGIEEAVRSYGLTGEGQGLVILASELRAIANMARRMDER